LALRLRLRGYALRRFNVKSPRLVVRRLRVVVFRFLGRARALAMRPSRLSLARCLADRLRLAN